VVWLTLAACVCSNLRTLPPPKTEEPSAAVLTAGTRIVVGGSGLDWRGERMGGTAYTPSFGPQLEAFKPVFVFAQDLYNEVK
jgi:hypothetical protein